MYIYTSAHVFPHKSIGPAIRRVATERTCSIVKVERIEQKETLFYSDDGVYLLHEKENCLKRLKLHDAGCKIIELEDGTSIKCDKSYWSFADDSYYLSPSYIRQDVLREIYRLPDAPSVSLVIETRNDTLFDIHFECRETVPVDSIMEDINLFAVFIDEQCVGKRS